MRTTLTLFALLLVTSLAFSQKSESGTYEELMKKSRRARTTSIVLVSTGPVIAAGGIGTLIYGLIQNDIGDSEAIYDINGNFIGYRDKKYTTEIVVGAVGTAVGLGLALSSIIFSNKASDLKREAKRLKLKSSTERISIPGLQNAYASNNARQFKISLIMPLGR